LDEECLKFTVSVKKFGCDAQSAVISLLGQSTGFLYCPCFIGCWFQVCRIHLLRWPLMVQASVIRQNHARIH